MPTIISYSWNFGDNNTSEEENPIHIYTEEGNYEVCLTLTYTQMGVERIDTYCEYINIGSSNTINITGMVNYGTNPSDVNTADAIVMLIESDEERSYFSIIDQTQTENAYYNFSNVNPDAIYFLYAIPLELGYLPTYFGDAIFWQDAASINEVNTTFYTINLVSFEGLLEEGIGTIEGILTDIAPTKAFSDLSGIVVVLLDENNNPIAYTTTDENGNFIFEDIALRDYTVRVEIVGHTSENLNVSLNEENPFVGNIEFNVHGATVSVKDIAMINVNSIFPNPAISNLNISMDIREHTNITINLVNIIGQVISSENIEVKGNLEHQINVKDIPQGIYILNIITENQEKITKKVVIK